MTKPQSRATHEVVARVGKLPDLETHLRVLTFPDLGGIQGVELRDFVPSSGEYQRGYWLHVSPEAVPELADILTRYGRWA